MHKKNSASRKTEAKLLGKTRPIFSGGQSAGRRSRADSGGGLAALFLLEVAASNHKTQGKQAEHKRAFLRFKDDGAAMKAKRTAKSIQPIPISAETSRLRSGGLAAAFPLHSAAEEDKA